MASRRDMRNSGNSGMSRRAARMNNSSNTGMSRREMRASGSNSGMSRREMRESGSSSYRPETNTNTGPRYRGGDGDSRYQGGTDTGYRSDNGSRRQARYNGRAKKSGCSAIIGIVVLVLLGIGIYLHFNQGNDKEWTPANTYYTEVINNEEA